MKVSPSSETRLKCLQKNGIQSTSRLMDAPAR